MRDQIAMFPFFQTFRHRIWENYYGAPDPAAGIYGPPEYDEGEEMSGDRYDRTKYWIHEEVVYQALFR